MNREKAIDLIKEMLLCCSALDGSSFELTPLAASLDRYQIIIIGVLDEKTKQQLQNLVAMHNYCLQIGHVWKTKRTLNKNAPDTHIIY